ncbi:uncharacterized protein LOC143863296 isoform X2 [Tasmannia lanceolata]
METLNETNGGNHVEEACGGNIRSLPCSPIQIADPVVYKLVRVEGDGRLVPATDDEVMEVEDLLADDKSEPPLVEDPGNTEGCISNDGLSCKKDAVQGSEDMPGLSQSENTEADERKLNATLEVSDQLGQLPISNEKHQAENSLRETAPLLSPTVQDDSNSTQLGNVEMCPEPKDEPITNGSSLSSDIGTSSIPDFSTIKGEICLDNLSIRELHETFRATFGRETTVKDKLWLKRRIAMGLTNSCDVSTTSFIIKDKTLIRKRVKEDTHSRMESITCMDGSISTGQITGAINDNCRDSPTSPTNQLEIQRCLSGDEMKPTIEYDMKSEETAAKRVRKPTRRYIEELSEVEAMECSGRLIPSLKNSGHGQSSPKSRVRPVQNVGSAGPTVVTRLHSLGGSGVQVPYVSRVRRGRPRENFMALMKYHPSGMAAKLVKKALGVRVSRQDGDKGGKMWKAKASPKRVEKPIVSETDGEEIVSEGEEQATTTCTDELEQAPEPEKLDFSGHTSDENVTTVPTGKGGARRKHHQAWTLCEVTKLVEGVSRYGVGRWSEIKRLAFTSYSYRTSVDLKDKWRNLLRASFSQAPMEKG